MIFWNQKGKKDSMEEVEKVGNVRPICLLLVKTPFQARIAKKMLLKESFRCYDVLYFTQHASEKDRVAYKHLAKNARRAFFITCPPHSGYLRRTLFFSWKASLALHRYHYDFVCLGSIDSFELTRIAGRGAARIISFDDGTANFNLQSAYHLQPLTLKAQLYRILLNAPRLDELKKRILRHYTLHLNLDNIVEKTRLEKVQIWQRQSLPPTSDRPITYFIGDVFDQHLTAGEMKATMTIARESAPDFYLMHPMESCPLLPEVPVLEDQGFLAEDIVLHSREGNPIHIIGGYSSVMLNLAGKIEKITMLASPRVLGGPGVETLAKKMGFDLVWLPGDKFENNVEG